MTKKNIDCAIIDNGRDLGINVSFCLILRTLGCNCNDFFGIAESEGEDGCGDSMHRCNLAERLEDLREKPEGHPLCREFPGVLAEEGDGQSDFPGHGTRGQGIER